MARTNSNRIAAFSEVLNKGDLSLKLKMLWLYGLSGLCEWYREVWKREAGERLCCDGYMCGCYGSDHASYWEWLWKTRRAR